MKRALVMLAVAAAALVAADFAVHHHVHFGWEGVPGGYGVFGLVAALVLTAVAATVGRALRRDEAEEGDRGHG